MQSEVDKNLDEFQCVNCGHERLSDSDFCKICNEEMQEILDTERKLEDNYD